MEVCFIVFYIDIQQKKQRVKYKQTLQHRNRGYNTVTQPARERIPSWTRSICGKKTRSPTNTCPPSGLYFTCANGAFPDLHLPPQAACNNLDKEDLTLRYQFPKGV